MTIKIYADPGSGSVRRVTTAAKIMGVPYEEVFTDLFSGAHKAPDYLTLNPNGLVPVMVDGDTELYEASAINIYLAEKFNSPLLPKGPARYEVLKWMFWSGEQWRIFSSTLFDEHVLAKVFGQPPKEKVIDWALARFRAAAAVLDQHLATRPYIVGDSLTLADIDIAAPFSQIDRSKLPLREFANIMAWHDPLLAELPEWRETKATLDQRVDGKLAQLGIVP